MSKRPALQSNLGVDFLFSFSKTRRHGTTTTRACDNDMFSSGLNFFIILPFSLYVITLYVRIHRLFFVFNYKFLRNTCSFLKHERYFPV